MQVSVVVPVYNEARTLTAVLQEIVAALRTEPEIRFEIIVVDDASTDDSLSQARAFTGGRVRCLLHPERLGSGAARRNGCRAAHGDTIAWIDADGTYAAAALPAMLARLTEYDQVIGARRAEFGSTRLLRRGVKSLAASCAAMLWQTRIPDLNSGLRVFRRSAIFQWIDELPAGFSCTTTATLAALNRGQHIAFHPIQYRPRASGSASKFHPVLDTCRLWKVIALQWWRRPSSVVAAADA